jgi:hypothetical protein
MPARVQVIHEAPKPEETEGDCALHLQWCLYVYEKGKSEYGYRFIWRRANGHLQPARGQARIPSIKDMEELIRRAKKEGWGNLGDE